MEFLPQMTGMEYSLGNIPEPTVPAGADLSNSNSLFVINKCRRDNPQKTTILEIYYILDGTCIVYINCHTCSFIFFEPITILKKSRCYLSIAYVSRYVQYRFNHNVLIQHT